MRSIRHLFTLLTLASSVSFAAPAAIENVTTGHYVVKFRDSATVSISQGVTGLTAYTSNSRLNHVLQHLGIDRLNPTFPIHAGRTLHPGHALTREGLERIQSFDLPVDQAKSALYTLRHDPEVEYAEPEYVSHSTALNDPYLSSSGAWSQSYADLWNLYTIAAPTAWTQATGSGVIVAVVDSGVDLTHPDIAANIAINKGETANNGLDDDGNGYIDDVYGWNFYSNNNNVQDDYGHGTHVAGIIAAVGNNGIGIAGIAYGAKILAVKTTNNQGLGTSTTGAQGIIYAADRGARVINNSWTCSSSQVVDDAVRYAHDKGAVVIAAAGNDSGVNVETLSPAGAPYAVTVAATDHTDQQASFSNIGMKLDVAAPGVDVLSLLAANSTWSASIGTAAIGGKYLVESGTSMASPHVAGVAALLLSQQPNLTPEQVRYWLRNSALDLGATGFDTAYGYGRLRADVALSMAAAGTAPAVQGAFLAPLKGQFLSGIASFSGEAYGPAFSSYELAYAPVTAINSFTTFAISQQAVPSGGGALGVLNTSGLSVGDYALRLRVKASNGTYLDYFDHFTVDPTVKSGWPQVLSTQSNSGAGSWEFEPLLVDLDGTGIKEVVVPTDSAIYVFNADGSQRAGFPYRPGGACEISGSVTAADLNGDGKPELIFPCWTAAAGQGAIMAITNQGVAVSGFPAGIVNTTAFSASSLLVRGHVTVADINNDGVPEIIAGGILQSSDGSQMQIVATVLNNKGVPLSGWPKLVSAAIPNNSNVSISGGRAMLADVNGDGLPEIVVTDYNGTGFLLAIYQQNGSLLRYIDTSAQFSILYEPIFADINGDGSPEFILAGAFPNTQIGASVVDVNGNVESGWPRGLGNLGTDPTPWANPFTVADLKQDGKLELVLGTNSGLHALDYSGQELVGWPKTFGQQFTGVNIAVGAIGSTGPGLLFQVDNRLWAVDSTGTVIPGWPKVFPIAAQTQPAIGSLSNNGNIDVVVDAPVNINNDDSQLLVYEMPAAAGTLPSSCPMYRCDAQRSGRVAPSHVAYTKVYSQVYLRGTNNAWGTTAMALVANNTWQATTTFGSTSSEGFKFDIYGNWTLNFGAGSSAGVAAQSGGNITVTQGAGSYTVTFNDSSKAYTVTKVGSTHIPPVANAGPAQTIVSATPVAVTLNGNASTDSDGNIVSYAWAESINGAWQAVATGVSPTLSNVTVGTHTYQLTVTDNMGTTGTAQVVVTVGPAGFTSVYKQVYVRGTNNAWGSALMTLVANNTWQLTTTFGATSSEGFKFDINGDWSLNFGSGSIAGIATQSGGNITVTQGAGSYTISFNDSSKAYTVTKVGSAPTPPVANAGSNQTLVSSIPVSVTLNGSASTDAKGTITSYAWAELVNGSWVPVATGVNPTLTNVSVGVHTYQLTVTDNLGASGTAQVVVTIGPDSFTSVYKQMYLRGTNNAWSTTAMTLAANNTWQVTATFTSASGQAFKFDVNGDWSLNFGAGSSAGIAAQSGGNIAMTQGAGTYLISFNDSTKAYSISKQ